MHFQKLGIALVLVLCGLVTRAAENSIPIGHLQESVLTDGYKKALVINLKGYIKASGETMPSEIYSRMSPASSVVENGREYLKASVAGYATTANEKSDSSGYVLLDPKTYKPYKMIMSDGEVTIYKKTNDYPSAMRLGSKALLSQSETFSPNDSKKPAYKTTEILSLARVGAESDLYQLCETDYEYGRSSNYKKIQSENTSCLIIDGQGALKGYAILLITPETRSTYQGSIQAE